MIVHGVFISFNLFLLSNVICKKYVVSDPYGRELSVLNIYKHVFGFCFLGKILPFRVLWFRIVEYVRYLMYFSLNMSGQIIFGYCVTFSMQCEILAFSKHLPFFIFHFADIFLFFYIDNQPINYIEKTWCCFVENVPLF